MRMSWHDTIQWVKRKTKGWSLLQSLLDASIGQLIWACVGGVATIAWSTVRDLDTMTFLSKLVLIVSVAVTVGTLLLLATRPTESPERSDPLQKRFDELIASATIITHVSEAEDWLQFSASMLAFPGGDRELADGILNLKGELTAVSVKRVMNKGINLLKNFSAARAEMRDNPIRF